MSDFSIKYWIDEINENLVNDDLDVVSLDLVAFSGFLDIFIRRETGLDGPEKYEIFSKRIGEALDNVRGCVLAKLEPTDKILNAVGAVARSVRTKKVVTIAVDTLHYIPK